MTFHFTLIYYFMIMQIILFILLAVPWPRFIRKFIMYVLDSKLIGYLQYIHLFLIMLVTMFLFESVRSHKKAEYLHEHGDNHGHKTVGNIEATSLEDAKIHNRIFYSERNIYLTSIALITTLALYRLIGFFRKISEKKHHIEELQKEKKEKAKPKDPKDKKND